MNNPTSYPEEQVLKAYNKDRPAGPNNMPQDCKQTTPLLTPTPKETDQEKYLVRRYERQYTTKRD